MAEITAGHVAAAVGGTLGGTFLADKLTDIYQWLFTWPIQHPTHDQCSALAILTIAALGGGSFAALRKKVDQVLAPLGDQPTSATGSTKP